MLLETELPKSPLETKEKFFDFLPEVVREQL